MPFESLASIFRDLYQETHTSGAASQANSGYALQQLSQAQGQLGMAQLASAAQAAANAGAQWQGSYFTVPMEYQVDKAAVYPFAKRDDLPKTDISEEHRILSHFIKVNKYDKKYVPADLFLSFEKLDGDHWEHEYEGITHYIYLEDSYGL